MGGRHGRTGSGGHVRTRRALLTVALAGFAAAASAAEAAKPAPTHVDIELLEFLGSLDVEEDGWQDYLEQRPVKAAQKVPEKTPPPPLTPTPKQAKAK
jgi:P pilus assembly chaperone PapD